MMYGLNQKWSLTKRIFVSAFVWRWRVTIGALLLGLGFVGAVSAAVPPCFKSDFDAGQLAAMAYGPMTHLSSTEVNYLEKRLLECVQENEVCVSNPFDGRMIWVEKKHFDTPEMDAFGEMDTLVIAVVQFRDQKTGAEHCITIFTDSGNSSSVFYSRTDLLDDRIVSVRFDREFGDLRIGLNELHDFMMGTLKMKPREDHIKIESKAMRERFIRFQ